MPNPIDPLGRLAGPQRRHRRLWPALLALVLVGTLATACTEGSSAPSPAAATTRTAPAGATAPVGAAAWALAGRLTTPEYASDTTAAMVEGLARSGIGTFADPSATRPERAVTGAISAMRLLDFQAHALAIGAWTGAGYTGAELDTVVPLPAGLTGMPTTAALLAGYVAAANSPGGAWARALMAGQNLLAPATLRFPAVVLVLFAADLADAGPSAGGDSDVAPTRAGPIGAVAPARMDLRVQRQLDGGICSAAENWINSTITGFFAALRLATPNSVAGAIVVSIWNWLVGAAQALVQTLISALTDAVLGTIRDIARMVSDAAEQIVSMLPYDVKVVASGDGGGGGTFTLGSKPLAGTFTATVSAGDLPDWPPVLADCAAVAKIKLPDFHAKDIPLTWGAIEALADPLLTGVRPAPTDDVTDAHGQASWGFQTATDPGDPHGEQRSQPDAMPVTVHRPEIEAARSRLTYALLGAIPDLLRPYVARLFAPYIDGLEGRLNHLLDARGSGIAILVFHADAPPTPNPAKASSTCGGTPVSPGTYAGTNTNTFTERVPMTGGAMVDHNTATGPVALTVAADGTVTGTWSFHMRDVLDENMVISGVSADFHSERTWEMTTGTIAGTVCDLALTSSPVRQISCVGTCGDGAAEPAPSGALPHFGSPPVVAPGHLTWQMRKDAADGTYTDRFTIAVVGPR